MTRLEKQIAEIYDRLVNHEEPINEPAACEYLGIEQTTMRQYVSQGKMAGTYVINVLGKRMFYKSKLVIKGSNHPAVSKTADLK